jgi:hypothetical protein
MFSKLTLNGDVNSIMMKSPANQQKRMGTTFLISAVSLILLCLSRPALSEVEKLDSWQTGQLHTKPSGTDRALIYIQHAESNSPLNLSDVTYGGYSMTKVVDYNCNLAEGYVYAAAFILLENDLIWQPLKILLRLGAAPHHNRVIP